MKHSFLEMFLSVVALTVSRVIGSFIVRPAMGAKSGVITSPSGADANMRTLGDTTPATGTIASVVRSALALAAAIKAVVINFVTGKAVVAPTGAAAPTGLTLMGTFTKDDPSKASSPWTFVAEDGILSEQNAEDLEAIVAARKPSMSVESLTNALEDFDAEETLTNAGGETPYRAVVAYDQADGEILFYGAATATVEAYDPAAQYAEDAAFVRAVAATGSTQFGE